MLQTNENCISRLHRYRDALYRLKHLGFEKVFSDNLADAVGVTASQVRKDLLVLGHAGNKRGGYKADDLIVKLNNILGKNKPQNVIVVGAGNIGCALMNYRGFEKEGIHIVAAFDSDESKSDRKAKIPVYPIGELKNYVRKHRIKVGIIAVPDNAAQDILDLMVSAGIRGALNFAPIRLKVPESFVIYNVNVGLRLETVIYFVNAAEKKGRDENHEA